MSEDNKAADRRGQHLFQGSTPDSIEQHFRDFNKDILDDLMSKCGDTIARFDKEDVISARRPTVA